ncbi:MAG: pentapeptide repeat-containing protein [Microcoleus sp. PH2017_22_RUC_O_B]|nr:pentapeptide repeat-containing protein [Microcoleus sp. PH2017_22_RUC_O_B]
MTVEELLNRYRAGEIEFTGVAFTYLIRLINAYTDEWERIPYDFLDGADFSGSDFRGSDLIGISFEGVNLSGSNLSNLDLGKCCFPKANLSGANLSNSCLWRGNFNNANLSNANLMGVDIAEASFRDANLSKANLSGAKLMETNFRRANLTEANFNHAQLFYSVRLMEANLMGATFEGVSLNVDGIFENTIMPDGSILTSSYNPILSRDLELGPKLRELIKANQEQGSSGFIGYNCEILLLVKPLLEKAYNSY